MNKEIETLLSDKDFTLIGSRGIGLNGNDYDFVVHMDNIEKYSFTQGLHWLDISNYVNVLPLGNGVLIKADGYDILGYSDNRDIVALTRARDVMKNEIANNNKFEDYSNKHIRVEVFETLYKMFQRDSNESYYSNGTVTDEGELF